MMSSDQLITPDMFKCGVSSVIPHRYSSFKGKHVYCDNPIVETSFSYSKETLGLTTTQVVYEHPKHTDRLSVALYTQTIHGLFNQKPTHLLKDRRLLAIDPFDILNYGKLKYTTVLKSPKDLDANDLLVEITSMSLYVETANDIDTKFIMYRL